MTRLEPLIVQTLGRSPYDDEVVYNEDPHHVPGTVRTGQQYDDRGRPINRETLQQSRNLVRASNEVLAAAGIIESHEGFKARDAAKKKEKDAREEDVQKAYRRRMYGQIALTCGVWGACGLRRRIELYRDYSQHPLMYLIHHEHQTSSWLRMFGAGLPALMLNRGGLLTVISLLLEPLHSYPAIGNVAHYITINPFSQTTKTVVTHVANYIMFHYKYFAILQQLGLVPAFFPSFVVPPLSFMAPFSSTSPFYLPTLPAQWTPSTALTFASQAALVIAPVVFLQLWYHISNTVISLIYEPIYDSLPHASNIPAVEAIEKASRERMYAAAEQHPRSHLQDTIPNAVDDMSEPYHTESEDTDGNSTTTWDADEYNELNNPPRPANPTPTSDPTTLDALEGRARSSQSHHPLTTTNNPNPNLFDDAPGSRRQQRRSSYASTHSSDAGETTTALITFDVENTDEPVPMGGTYSAELRQAPDEVNRLRGLTLPEGTVEYNVTAMSIFPAHLFADGVTVLLSTASTVLIESIMVRAVAASWLGKGKGGGSWGGDGGIWPVFSKKGGRLSWLGWGNIGIVFLADFLMTGVIWGACMGVMWVCDLVLGDGGEEREEGKGDGDGDGEGEGDGGVGVRVLED